MSKYDKKLPINYINSVKLHVHVYSVHSYEMLRALKNLQNIIIIITITILFNMCSREEM